MILRDRWSGLDKAMTPTDKGGLKISFSRLQTLIGLAAGILSIAGALAAFFKPAPGKGELVAIVQDAKTGKTVPDATIEILTLRDAIVTTIKPNWSGKAQYPLDECHYRVRVSHPRYSPEIRDVQLISSQSTEIRIQLRSPAIGDSLRRLFHR